MLTEEERRLVDENRGKDPARLALSLRASRTIRPAIVAQQVDAYNRLAVKAPTWATHDGLEFPFPVAIQQCSSEPIARFRQRLATGDSLIDLTGGLGVDCYFMGEKRRSVTYVDASADAVAAARHNFAVLGVGNTRFENFKAEDFVAACIAKGVKVDTIFIDPSRRNATGGRVFQLSDCSPDITVMAPDMTKVAKNVLVKLSPLLDVTMTLKQLANVTDVYAIGHANECKDLMLRLSADPDVTDTRLHAVTVGDDGTPEHHVTFTRSDEKAATAKLSSRLPRDGDFIFIPSPSLMKAAPFALLTKMYPVRMIAPGTHVYTSEADVTDFPGRRFVVISVYDLSKRSLAELRKTTQSASVAVRNFGMTAEALRRKLKLGESSQDFIFGLTGGDDKPHLLLCQKPT